MKNPNLIYEQLKDSKLMKDLSSKDLMSFIENIEIKTISSNEIIINEDSHGTFLVFLIDGEVSISRKMTLKQNQNDEYQEKEILKTDSTNKPIFGEIGLFGKSHKRTATIKTLTNCTIGIIDKEKFFNVCENNTTLGYQLLKNISVILSERIMDTNTNVMKLTTALCLILEK
tara:strand:+ start:408 stop:923 length:516 start_codon:yes stop_codon:yes gene_type:complete